MIWAIVSNVERTAFGIVANVTSELSHIRWSPRIVVGLIVVHIALDWATNIEPTTELAITLWNPTAAVSLIMALAWGPRAVLPIWVAAYLSGLVVEGYPPFAFAAVIPPSIIAVGYATMGVLIRHRGIPKDFLLEPTPTAAALVVVHIGAGLISLMLVLVSVWLGELDVKDASSAAVSTWTGDATGLVVLLPAFFVFRSWSRFKSLAESFWSLDGLVYGILVIIALCLMFVGPAENTLQFCYFSLLPVVWLAVRRDLAASIISIAILQFTFVVLVLIDQTPSNEFLELQVFMLVVATTGILISTAVGSSRRKAAQINDQRLHIERLERTTAVAALGAALAHELSQPISTIRTAAHIATASLRLIGASEPLAKSIATIKQQVEVASARISSLRSDLQNSKHRPEVTNIADVVYRCLHVLHDEFPRAVQNVSITSAESPACLVDREHADQIVLNLLRNACFAIRDRGASGRIHICIQHFQGSLLLQVSDNGPGIEREIQSRIFDPMISTRVDGVGLGLFIVRTLCELNAAKIELRDIDEWSTCFEVRFKGVGNG